MPEMLLDLIELLPISLGIEISLLVAATLLLPRLVSIVRGGLNDDLTPREIAKYINVAFTIGLPVAIVIWFVSILVRYL